MMPMNLFLPGPTTPQRFLLQAVVPPVNTNRIVCMCICVRMGLFKSCSTCMARLITHTAFFFALKWGAAPLTGPSCQGDPTCPRMAGRQADRLGERGLFTLSLLYGAHRMLPGTLDPGYFQTAVYIPVSKQLISFFNKQLPQHQAQVKVTSLACWCVS